MSIIIVGLTSKHTIIMSDGKVTDVDENIENYKKIIKINPYVCIGYTGRLEVVDKLFEKFNALAINFCDSKTDSVACIIYELAKEVKDNFPSSGNTSFVICGVNSLNQMESIAFNTKDFSIDRRFALSNNISIQVLNDYPNVSEITSNIILKCGNLEEGMKQTIKYISTVDTTVNDYIFIERIIL